MVIKSILPAHFTELEKALDLAGGDRLALISSQENGFWNPDLCPEEALALLAWAHSVDYWSSSWPVHVKRNVIREAPRLHQIKGTKAAILNALATLNVDAEYQEWHEIGTQKGTFRITAFLSENLDVNGQSILSEAAIISLHRLLNAVKRGSNHYELRTGLHHDLTIAVGGVVTGAVNVHCTEEQSLTHIEPIGSLAIAGVRSASFTINEIGMVDV